MVRVFDVSTAITIHAQGIHEQISDTYLNGAMSKKCNGVETEKMGATGTAIGIRIHD